MKPQKVNKTGKSKAVGLIELLLTIGTVIVIFVTIGFLLEFRSDYKYLANSPYKDYSYEYALDEGNYARVASYVKETEPYGHPSSSVRRYFGLGQYFYASSMAAIAQTMGDKELESYWSDKSLAAADEAESLSEYIILIDEQLGR